MYRRYIHTAAAALGALAILLSIIGARPAAAAPAQREPWVTYTAADGRWSIAYPQDVLSPEDLGNGTVVFISRDPDRTAVFKFTGVWHFIRQVFPELLRILRQCKLGFAVVHHHDVTHARRCRAAAHEATLQHENTALLRTQVVRNGGADNAAADNDHVSDRVSAMRHESLRRMDPPDRSAVCSRPL